eukprot:TRINITY_DN8622_c0_g1_i2.p1 TRINITY_DN8622_c0_g1~~TRINITY_DN8622_c0_g1_i2.p1  ORF type:complete len:113 (-),score=12.58 TRINITY_DN8622_c0_g1_i2:275-613(-)
MNDFYKFLSKDHDESVPLHSLLEKIHTKFQLIHPFRDGNGRMGRLILNILSLQRGYPVIWFSPGNKGLFSTFVDMCHHNQPSLFRRSILEARLVALMAYEEAIGQKLLEGLP